MDPPLADVVSFSERARALRGEGVTEGGAGPAAADGQEPVASEPADLAREAIFHRLGQLVQPGPDAGVRSVDDELAVLVYDSATDPAPLLGIRGDPTATTRQLTFRSPHLVLEVQLEGAVRELTCQVVPPQRASLEVRHRGGALQLGVDDFGTFHAPELPEGAVSLRCVPLAGDTGPIATSWIAGSDHPPA
ncbi:MAG TPA: hypothetical protein VEH29_02400 [Acidimicrobiales bacterium]|nr:hypothetical protein [Acidimicrobiales bacterium]